MDNTVGDASSAAASQGTARSLEEAGIFPVLQREGAPGDARIPTCCLQDGEAGGFCCVSQSGVPC